MKVRHVRSWFCALIGAGLFLTVLPQKAEACCSCSSIERKIKNHTRDRFRFHREEFFLGEYFRDYIHPALKKQSRQSSKARTSQTTAVSALMDNANTNYAQTLRSRKKGDVEREHRPHTNACTIASANKGSVSTAMKAEKNANEISKTGFDLASAKKGTPSEEGYQNKLTTQSNEYIVFDCNPADNNGANKGLCSEDAKDTNYNSGLAFPWMRKSTIELGDGANPTDDRRALLSASNLLYTAPPMSVATSGTMDDAGTLSTLVEAQKIQSQQSLTRSSMARVAALKSSGSGSNADSIHAIGVQRGLTKEQAIKKYGESPSKDAELAATLVDMYQTPNASAEFATTPKNSEQNLLTMEMAGLRSNRETLESKNLSVLHLSMILKALNAQTVASETNKNFSYDIRKQDLQQ